jgi:hypothetical protein
MLVDILCRKKAEDMGHPQAAPRVIRPPIANLHVRVRL